VPTTRHHLLVIDDEPYIGRMIQMQFERGPYRVSMTGDGPAGLAFLQEHGDVALVLVDLNLPGGLSGLDVIERARREPATAAVPFVVLTATGQQGQLEQAHALGAAGLVTKPFSPNKLYQQVGALLGVPAAEEA
jgi:CheY-like chemotaxis protein